MPNRYQIEQTRKAVHQVDERLAFVGISSLVVTFVSALPLLIEVAKPMELHPVLKLIAEILLGAGMSVTVIITLILAIRRRKQYPPLDYIA